MANRVAEVNKVLAKQHGKGQLKLTRGRDYYYVRGPLAEDLFSTAIYVCHADSMRVERWLEEIDELLSHKSTF